MKQNIEQCTLITKNLILSPLSSSDLKAINEFEIRNKNHLAMWEATTRSDSKDTSLYLTTQNSLEEQIKECEKGVSVRFLIRPKVALDLIIGFCNFTQIFHGPFQACYIGYKIDLAYQGKGFMFEALQRALVYVFEELKIHRIMANYRPSNVRSAKILHRLGFEIEGYAKNYLLINNRWEDHILTAMCTEKWLLAKDNSISTEAKNQSTSNVILREVQISDAPSLVPLMDQLGYPIDEKTLCENIQKYLSLPTQKAWVAESTGQIAGCIAVAITNYFHRPGSFLRVITMVVDNGYRRSGIGRTLMSLAEKFAKDHGCSHVELTSGMHREKLGSHKFYQSLGYIALNESKKYFAKKLE
jgi:ribosomal-protein-alanine N-acetyltransferase